MIIIKTDQEIAVMRQGGLILKKIMNELRPWVCAGVSTAAVNQKAEELIKKHEVSASFKTVKGYHWAVCLPINDQIVHTPPSRRILKDGDLLTIDIGVCFQSYHTDYATSIIIGDDKSPSLTRFLTVGKQALDRAIAEANDSGRVGNISRAIYDTVSGAGYFIVKNLTGHGIGQRLHEDPLIPGYIDKPLDQTIKLKEGMTLAIEVIYAMGTSEMVQESGGKWSLATRDGSLAACFEKTIAVGKNKAFILT